MTSFAKHGFLGAVVVEIGIVFALFVRYAQEWGNESAVVALFIVAVGISLWAAHRAAHLLDSGSMVRSWQPSSLMVMGMVVGLGGMSFAFAAGSHLSGSAAIYTAIVQSGILGVAALRLRKRR